MFRSYVLLFHTIMFHIHISQLSIEENMVSDNFSLIPFSFQKERFLIVLGGFEPPSKAPKASMLDHYTTGLRALFVHFYFSGRG